MEVTPLQEILIQKSILQLVLEEVPEDGKNIV